MANEKRYTFTYDPGFSLEVEVLDDLTQFGLDNADGAFRSVPATPRIPVEEFLAANGYPRDVLGEYVFSDDRTAWPNGPKTIILYEAGGTIPVRSMQISITNDAVDAVTGAGVFTYQQVIDDANVKLRNADGQQWDATVMLSLLNDAIQLALHAASLLDPEQYATTYDIPLTVAGGYGPYDLPADFKMDLFIENDLATANPADRRIAKINRWKSRHGSGSGRPAGYWLQGRAPVRVYFDLAPDADRTFTLFYIPFVARQSSAGMGNYVPLDGAFFEPLVQYLIKFAGDMDEYMTMTEDAKIAQMSGVVSRMLSVRSNPIFLSITGVGF